MATTAAGETRTGIAAAILAGGRGERLGGTNKALIEIGGRRLIDRAIAAVDGAVDAVLVMIGQTPLPGLAHRQVRDLDSDYGGPLAGLAAAVDALQAEAPEFILTLAVDTPFFPSDFAHRAREAIVGREAVLAAYAGQTYPTNGLWRYRSVAQLPAQLRDGSAPHSLKALAARIGAVPLDYATWSTDDPFANANTPEELANLRSRAGRKPFG